MKVYDEIIDKFNGIRIQHMLWAGQVWAIYCNDRFKPKDFKIKVHCENCGPDRYVPKVLEIFGHHICNGCLTRMIEMLNAATLEDCGKDRNDRKELEKKLGRGNGI